MVAFILRVGKNLLSLLRDLDNSSKSVVFFKRWDVDDGQKNMSKYVGKLCDPMSWNAQTLATFLCKMSPTTMSLSV